MKRLIPAVLAMVMLAGCGTAPGLVRASAKAGAVQAQSKLGTEKGVRGMFIAVFTKLDADSSNYLTPEEVPAKLLLAGLPAEAPEDPKAVMKQLDMNGDGKVSLREFYRRELLEPVLAQFRNDALKVFQSLDKNGDRALVPAELKGTSYVFDELDRNMNGRITLSEFEDGIAATLDKGGGFLPAEPAPLEPVPSGEQ